MSISFRAGDGDGGCSYVLLTGRPTAQVCRPGPKVGGRLSSAFIA